MTKISTSNTFLIKYSKKIESRYLKESRYRAVITSPHFFIDGRFSYFHPLTGKNIVIPKPHIIFSVIIVLKGPKSKLLFLRIQFSKSIIESLLKQHIKPFPFLICASSRSSLFFRFLQIDISMGNIHITIDNNFFFLSEFTHKLVKCYIIFLCFEF